MNAPNFSLRGDFRSFFVFQNFYFILIFSGVCANTFMYAVYTCEYINKQVHACSIHSCMYVCTYLNAEARTG